MSNASLEQNFWAKAVATTLFDKKSPTSTLVGKTPMEEWSSKNPSMRHLKVFAFEA